LASSLDGHAAPPPFESSDKASFEYPSPDQKKSPNTIPSPRSRLPAPQLLSFVFLLLCVAYNFFARPADFAVARAPHDAPSADAWTPPVRSFDDLFAHGSCESNSSTHVFDRALPVSRPNSMSLLQEAQRVAGEFEYSDDAVRKGVKEFISQMST
jgi:hypothetical protein